MTATAPLVTVIVPTYKQERLIGHTLRSILEQDYRPLEIIVCDDDSPDNTEAAVKALGYADIIRYKRIAHTGIPAATMNAALREAKGEIIMFLDGDDQYLPGKIRAQVEYLASHPECGMLFADAYYVETGSIDRLEARPGVDPTYFGLMPPPEKITIAALFPQSMLPVASVAFRRAVRDAVPLDESYRFMWDWVFTFDALKKGFAVECLKQPVALYRKYAHNLTSNPDNLNRLIAEKIRAFEACRDHLPAAALERQTQRWHYEMLKQSIKFKKFPSFAFVMATDSWKRLGWMRLKALFYWVSRLGRDPG